MQRADRIVQAVVSCTLTTLAMACSQGPGPDDPARWYGAPAGAFPSAQADEDDTDADTDTGGKADSDSGTDGSDDPSDGNSSGPSGNGSGDDSNGAGDDNGATSGNGGSGNEVLDACLDIAADACEACGCNSCLQPLEACELDAGCVAIRTCAQQSGCTDTISCYEACESVINQHGGALGNSGTLAAQLSECMDNSCAADCS